MSRGYRSTHGGGVTLEYVCEDASFVGETLAALSEALSSLAEYFELGDDVPQVRAILAPNRAEFDRCVKEVLKLDSRAPSHPWRLATPQGTGLAIVSPRAYENGPQYTPDGYRRLLVHETVHIVEEYLTPNVAGTARWWSEGLAVYLSGHWREELPLVLDGVRTRSIPAIADMEGDATFGDATVKLCYTWGWTFVRYVEQTYARRMIRRIVRECDDDDVFRIVGEDREALEERWQDWLSCPDSELVPGSDIVS